MNHTSEVTLPADAPEFVLTRVFDAPRALVYKCWMEPRHLARWWGPKPFTCPVCEVDARVGGEFRLVMRSPDGDDYPMRGIFREIVPNERIVKEDDVSEHSEEWHDMVDPDRKGQGKRKIDMLTTVTFEDHGQGHQGHHRTRFPSIAMRDSFAKIGMKEGWSSSLEKLEDLLDAIKGVDREIHIVAAHRCAARQVFKAFSDPTGTCRLVGAQRLHHDHPRHGFPRRRRLGLHHAWARRHRLSQPRRLYEDRSAAVDRLGPSRRCRSTSGCSRR